jgi:8-oxo-dGTP pyrophosphatase MutT (NUDIX family)
MRAGSRQLTQACPVRDLAGRPAGVNTLTDLTREHGQMRTLASEEVYRNHWMSVREDRVMRADGTQGMYGVVDKPGFALAIPYDNGGFWLVEQYRYPVRRRAWEFPQGSWDAASGTPQDLARAELAEETGLVASRVEHLGHLYAAYGFCSQGFDVYLATGLVQGAPAREATESDMEHRFIDEGQFIAWIQSGQIIDAASVAAYSLFRLGCRSG